MKLVLNFDFLLYFLTFWQRGTRPGMELGIFPYDESTAELFEDADEIGGEQEGEKLADRPAQ